ncbi:hypothetical protein ACWC1C_03365 [Streptomyces sp. NPDC001705]
MAGLGCVGDRWFGQGDELRGADAFGDGVEFRDQLCVGRPGLVAGGVEVHLPLVGPAQCDAQQLWNAVGRGGADCPGESIQKCGFGSEERSVQGDAQGGCHDRVGGVVPRAPEVFSGPMESDVRAVAVAEQPDGCEIGEGRRVRPGQDVPPPRAGGVGLLAVSVKDKAFA